MKAVKIILTTVVFFLATSAISAQDKKGSVKEEQVVFSVNMHCQSCEQRIKKNIPYEKGVKDLKTNLDKNLVTIKYQPNITDKVKLKKSIEKLGYTCEEVKEQAK